MPNENDATIEEKPTPPESSPEEKSSNDENLNISEDEKTQEDELGSGIENYDKRFKQVYSKMKKKEREIEEMQKKLEKKDTTEEQSNFIPETWEQVFETFEQRQQQKLVAQTKKEKELEAQINGQIQEVKKLYKDLNDDEIWDYMAEQGVTNVYEAATKINAKKLDNKDNKSVSGKIGSTSKNASAGKSELSYEQIHNISLDDIKLPD